MMKAGTSGVSANSGHVNGRPMLDHLAELLDGAAVERVQGFGAVDGDHAHAVLHRVEKVLELHPRLRHLAWE